MRYENFKENQCFYLTNRGANGAAIFLDKEDKARFMFLITHFQSPTRIYNVSWYTQSFTKNNALRTNESRIKKVLKNRSVELLAFSITDSHFHLLVRNLEEGTLSVYMHRILTAYSKYFNSKYSKKGHVFDGPFKAASIKNNEELENVSVYIHRLANEEGLKDTYEDHPYSSYRDYIGTNRWNDLLLTEEILKRFKNQAAYRNFVETYKDNGLKPPLQSK